VRGRVIEGVRDGANQEAAMDVPRLDACDMMTLSMRGAMELPERYTPVRFENLGPEVARLRSRGATELVRLLSEPEADARERFAAGALLSLLGDPRLDPLAPAMIPVPGGRVRIGLEPDRIDAVARRWARVGVKAAWIAKEAPAFEVRLAPYRIGKYPVTNAEYFAFVSATGHHPLPTSWPLGCYPLHAANHPVYTVSAESADAYAAWLAAKTGRRFRLPSEAEWEHAAAGSDGREFPWGDELEPDRANTVESRILSTTPVGMFPRGASPFGALDLAGNVEEYVADEFAPYPGAPRIEDNLTEKAGRYRVARGGSFTRFGDLARCRRRHGRYPSDLYAMGFRLAEDGEG
jgi:toxoflavin biosynthesis protein ToxD